MITFEVHDMTCGHCVSSITQAVRAIDPSAKLTADLATHRVQIESAGSDRTQLSNAIREAGYTPVPVDDAAVLKKQAPPRSSCCCR